MNVLVVDTSSWITFFHNKKQSQDLELALKEGRVYLPPLVAAELTSAAQKPNDRVKLMDFLKELPLCDSSLEHWFRVGELRAKCSKAGFSISTPDAHIAQCSLDLNGYLVTEDSIFTKVSKLISLKLL